MGEYVEEAKGKTIVELKENVDFQTDLVRFLSSSRKNFSVKELQKKGVDFMIDEYVEHMRGQDTNEVTALKDLYFAKDENARESDRAAFGRLMMTWDNVEGVGTGKFKGAVDYLESLATSPATLAGVFTGGYSKLAAASASKATQIATRSAVKRILSKEFGKQALKGAGRGAVIEGTIGAGQIEAQEGAREATVDSYEGISAVDKAMMIGLQATGGGVTSGLSRAFSIKEADKVAESLITQSGVIAFDKLKSAKKAVSVLTKTRSTKVGKEKVNNILNKMNGLVDVLSKRDVTKEALDPKNVVKGDDLKNTILTTGGNTNITSGLSRHTLQGITAAALDLGEAINLQPGKRISSAVAEAIETGKISTPEIQDIIKSYGLTKEEFGYIFLSDLSEAGKTLGKAGQIAKALKKDNVFKILGDIETLSEKGVGLYNDQLAKEIVATIDLKKTWGDTVLETLRQSDSARIAFMTSQLGTTAANTMFSTARIGIDVVEEVFRQVLKPRHVNATGGKVPLTALRSITASLRGVSWNKQDALLVKEMYKRDFPEEYQKIFFDVNRAEVSVGTDTTVGKIGAWVNGLNSAVDSRFKQASFYASLDRQLLDSGDGGLKGFLASGKNSLLDLPDQGMKEKAVNASLDFVFQKGYSKDVAGGIPNYIINLHKKAPFVVSGFLGMPFPRYVANHIEFINDYTPIGLITGGSKNFSKVYSGEFKDPATRMARQLTGLTLFTGAVYARGSQVEFDENGKATGMKTNFSDMSFGEEGETKRLGRVSGALAAHQLIGDIFVRWHYGLPMPKMTGLIKDTLDVAGGLGNMGFDQGLISDVNKVFDEGSVEPIARRFATILSTFTYPGTVARDLLGQVNPESGYMPYTLDLMLGDEEQKEHNLLVSMFTDTESLNRLVRMLPEIESLQYTQSLNGKTAPVIYDPIGGGPIRSVNPITKQLLGVESKRPPNTLQKTINTLGLKEFQLYSKRKVKNPVLDILVRRGLSKTLNKDFEKLISEPLRNYEYKVSFDELSTEVQRLELTKFINKSIRNAEQHYEMYFQELAAKKPKAAAAYLRNAYAISVRSAKAGTTDMIVKSMTKGEFTNADDYINDSENITEELERKRAIMDSSKQYDSMINK